MKFLKMSIKLSLTLFSFLSLLLTFLHFIFGIPLPLPTSVPLHCCSLVFSFSPSCLVSITLSKLSLTFPLFVVSLIQLNTTLLLLFLPFFEFLHDNNFLFSNEILDELSLLLITLSFLSLLFSLSLFIIVCDPSFCLSILLFLFFIFHFFFIFDFDFDCDFVHVIVILVFLT